MESEIEMVIQMENIKATRRDEMEKEKLDRIEKKAQGELEYADRIMDGGDNYDGADGARIIQGLCATILDLVGELRKNGND